MATKAARYAVLTVAAAIVFLPIYTAVVIAIQPAQRLVVFPGVLLPRSLAFSSLRVAFNDAHMSRYLVNSAVVTIAIVVSQVITSMAIVTTALLTRYRLM